MQESILNIESFIHLLSEIIKTTETITFATLDGKVLFDLIKNSDKTFLQDVKDYLCSLNNKKVKTLKIILMLSDFTDREYILNI